MTSIGENQLLAMVFQQQRWRHARGACAVAGVQGQICVCACRLLWVVVQRQRREGCKCDISVAVTPLSRHCQLSPIDVIVVSHSLFKMYQFAACLILLLNAWKIFVSSQPEDSCTAAPARDTLEHLELNARRMEQSLE